MTKSGKHCGKRKNCVFCEISSFFTMFSKSRGVRKAFIWGKGVKTSESGNGNVLLNHLVLSHYKIELQGQTFCLNFSISSASWVVVTGYWYALHDNSDRYQTGSFLCNVNELLDYLHWRTHHGECVKFD